MPRHIIVLRRPTAELVAAAFTCEQEAAATHARAVERLQDTLRPLMSEAGIASGQPISVTNTEPYELTIDVDPEEGANG